MPKVSENGSGLTNPVSRPSRTPAKLVHAPLTANDSADCASGAMPIVRAARGCDLAATNRIRSPEAAAGTASPSTTEAAPTARYCASVPPPRTVPRPSALRSWSTGTPWSPPVTLLQRLMSSRVTVVKARVSRAM